MSLNTFTIAALTYNLRNFLLNGKISKIQQPERDEIILQIRSKNQNQKLVISANASNPIIYIDNDTKKTNPINAPSFCMNLRKHLINSKIIDIYQVNNDRIIEITLSTNDELGDCKILRLIIELMGKHSNIILTNENNKIIDSIKHIDLSVSSIRQVFPGATYFRVYDEKKLNLFDLNINECLKLMSPNESLLNAIMNNFSGIFPQIIYEVSYRLNMDSETLIMNINSEQLKLFFNNLYSIINDIKLNKFEYYMYYKNNIPYTFSCVEYKIYSDMSIKKYDNIFTLIIDFYSKRLNATRINDKTQKLRTIINNNIKKLNKKLDIWDKQLYDCSKKDEFKLYGELLLAYTYEKPLDDYIICNNYYDNYNEIKIKIDKHKSISQNSQIYFNKYNKLKRTKIAIENLYPNVVSELAYLNSVIINLKNVENVADINGINEELIKSGYIKNINKKNKVINQSKSIPLKFIDDIGYEYYVGKNNLQNEYITFELASSNDWWFHIKGQSGPHVIVKNHFNTELPDNIFINAASLAAYYSNVDENKVEIDYTLRKNIKKPKNGHIGMVIYNTNYSIIVEPKIPSILKQIK